MNQITLNPDTGLPILSREQVGYGNANKRWVVRPYTYMDADWFPFPFGERFLVVVGVTYSDYADSHFYKQANAFRTPGSVKRAAIRVVKRLIRDRVCHERYMAKKARLEAATSLIGTYPPKSLVK